MRALVATLVIALGSCGAPEEKLAIVYDARYAPVTSLDVYLPSGSGARPAVMLIHGGSWRSGNRDSFRGVAQRFARSGYVAITVDYRLFPDAIFPAAVQDCACALSFVRKHAAEYRVNPDRIAMMGYSAGAHLASLVGLSANSIALAPDCASGPTSPPRAVIDGAGPTDLWVMANNSAVVDFMGGTPADRPVEYDLGSPIERVAAHAPSFLIIHGGADAMVSIEQSQRFRDALVAAGNQAHLLEVVGGGHVFSPEADGDAQLATALETPEAWLAIQSFLARTIGKP